MADQFDVENALVAIIAAALYPLGSDEASVPGPDCRIYRGWPNSAALDADLAAGKINVTVFPDTGNGHNTTRYVEQWVGRPALPALSGVVVGDSVTFVGSADVGQIAGILVDRRAYAYRTQLGDSPALVAANLAVLARDHAIVQLAGGTITIPGVGGLLARVVADAPAQREVRRQVQNFRVTCWCPTHTTRDVTAAAIDGALANLRFIDLADSTQGRLIYIGTTVFDQSQDAGLYRRDLTYSVEYATTLAASLPAMLFGALGLNTANFTV